MPSLLLKKRDFSKSRSSRLSNNPVYWYLKTGFLKEFRAHYRSTSQRVYETGSEIQTESLGHPPGQQTLQLPW